MIKGIDVSKYQGNIDWKKVKASGINFAMIRAGYGKFESQKDPKFEQNYNNARAAGILVGAYYYSYAKSKADAKKEAQLFIKYAKGKRFEMPLALDVEEQSQAAKGRGFVSDIIRTFCEEVENAGYYVSVYANKNWLDNYIDDDCKRRYDIWLAQWANKPSYKGSFGMWQNSSNGAVSGIAGRVDTDFAYKDYPSIIKREGLNGFPSGASPTPPASTALKAGTMISLYNTPIYISSTARLPATKKSGTYYIYDGELINGRYRITNSIQRVGKKPTSKYVTGYVKKSDIL